MGLGSSITVQEGQYSARELFKKRPKIEGSIVPENFSKSVQK
jgi:hypothetical protein